MSKKTPYKLDQVAIRMVKERPLISDEPVNSPEKVVKLVHELLKDYDREVFAVINFQTNLQPINMNIVSVGALNASMIHPREMLKSIVLSNAAAVMMVHNHPSGQVQPSAEDISVTAKMSQLMKLMEVSLLDHIILGPGEQYYSFHESDIKALNGEIPVKKDRGWER